METKDRAIEQAKAQYESIVEDLQALDKAEKKGAARYDGRMLDRDTILERIQEEPLSIQVRSYWCEPEAKMEAGEFEILLATGGPACRIIGELDEYKLPYNIQIQGQDWGTPWITYGAADPEVLFRYANLFWYGA